mgnify:FL=1
MLLKSGRFINRLIDRIFKLIKFKLINLVNKTYIPRQIYIFLFVWESQYIKSLKMINNLYTFSEIINVKNLQWSFPIRLRERGRKCYLKGLINRGFNLAKEYNIDKIDFKENDIIIDCGANLGDSWIFLDQLNIELKYFAFEPGKDEFKALEYNIQNNHSKVCSAAKQKALGNIETKSDIFYSPKGGDSSLIEISNYEYQYQVEVDTLDSFIQSNGLLGKKSNYSN